MSDTIYCCRFGPRGHRAVFVVLSAARLSGPLQCVPRLGQARQRPVSDAVWYFMSRRYRRATFSFLAGCSQLSITSRSTLAGSSSKSENSKFSLRRLDAYQHPSEQTDAHMSSLKEWRQWVG